MEEFCLYCEIGSYNSFCTCKVSGEMCGMVRRCPTEQRYKPLQNMNICRIRKEHDNMNKDKLKVRFEKHGLLYVEHGFGVITVKNPFTFIPEYIDDVVNVDNIWYVKGYEPKKEKTEVKNFKTNKSK